MIYLLMYGSVLYIINKNRYNVSDNTIVEEILLNVSIKDDKKKKKNKHDVSQIIEPVVEITNSAKKKSKKNTFGVENVDLQTQNTGMVLHILVYLVIVDNIFFFLNYLSQLYGAY